MSRLALLLCATSLLFACEQPTPQTTSSTVPKAVSTSSGAQSDQDLCYDNHSAPGHDHQRSLVACNRLIATGGYQGFALAKLHNNAGTELREMYRYEEALAAHDRAIAIKPDYTTAWRNKSYVLMDLYRYDEALAAVDRAVEIAPESSSNTGQRGRVLRNLERFSEARDMLELSLALKPDDEWTIRELGWVSYDEDKFEDALRLFEESLEMNRNAHWSHFAVGYVLIDLDREEDAIAAFDRAIDLNPKAPSLYNLRGYTRLIENKPVFNVQAAIVDLERAISLNPRQEYALHHLAIAYAYQGRGAEALTMLKRGVEVRLLKSKVRRVIRILWDKKLTEDAKAASELLKQSDT